MDVARVTITGSKATAELLMPVTTGMVGATVSITYDGEWDDLKKQVLFRRGNSKIMQATGNTIPHEIIASPYETLFVGVYGFTSDGTIVIPTVWAKICEIRQGVDPEGDESADPTLPVYTQIMADIGDLSQLNTESKESLVEAVNEVSERSVQLEETFRILAVGAATLEDIAEALREDKVCYLSQSGSYLPLTNYNGVSAMFSGWIDSNHCMTATVTADGWSIEWDIRRKVTEITEESDDDQIPTAKAVYDALEERETHSFDGAEILFDGDVTLTDENGHWVYYFDAPLGVTYGETYTLIADGVITTAYVSKDNAFFASGVGGNNAFLYSDHISVYGDNLKSFNLKIAHGAGEIHHLDAMYIPATFPRLGVAEVGQMVMVSEVDENGKPTAWEASKPLRLDADLADTYLADSTYGDAALAAIKAGRQILVKVPNADGGNFTAIYSPILMYQVPNYANKYLYLFFLRDEKQDLSSLGIPVQMPTYGELKMLLSQEYNSNPLEE